MTKKRKGRKGVQDDFVRFMYALVLHYTDEWGGRSSPEEFKRHMDNSAPSVIQDWFRHLRHEGDLTLQQAMLPSGDYAKIRADKNGWTKRDETFAWWLFLDRRYEAGKGEKPKSDAERIAAEFPDDQEAALKAWQRYKKDK